MSVNFKKYLYDQDGYPAMTSEMAEYAANTLIQNIEYEIFGKIVYAFKIKNIRKVYEDAVEDWKVDYRRENQCYLKRADSGDEADAQYWIGKRYSNWLDFDLNHLRGSAVSSVIRDNYRKEAVDYLNRAAEQNHVEAQVALALLEQDGHGFQMMESAAKAGHGVAQYWMHTAYAEPFEGYSSDEIMDGLLDNTLPSSFPENFDVKTNKKKAKMWFKLALEQGIEDEYDLADYFYKPKDSS